MSSTGVIEFDSHIALLRDSELFIDADIELARHFRRRSWASGEVISSTWCRDYFHVIVEGRLELARYNEHNGRGFTVSLLGPGDVFDAVRLAGGTERQVVPTAVGELTALWAPYSAVQSWCESSAGFGRSMMRALSRQLIELEETATDLAIHTTSTRLARRIARIVRDPRSAANDERSVWLSNDMLARMIGSVRIVVNRHIQELKRAGAIETSRGRLEVSDHERLLDTFE